MQIEEKYMARCIALARKGAGNTSPNPMVGAVIVHQDKIIGEGYHRRCGEAHAEVNAVGMVQDKSLLTDSTLYVSLEPCSHFGKTPPCVDLIIKHRIPRVVVGCKDPFPEVSGRGVARLQEAGVEVVTGVLEQEARDLNRYFMTSQLARRPYIILKWAQSRDGFIDGARKGGVHVPVVLSTPQTMRMVHKLRSEVDAIMVGTNTVLNDNPSLTVRSWSGRNPVRVIVDRTLRIPHGFHVLDGAVRTLVFTEKTPGNRPGLEYVEANFTSDILDTVLSELHARKIQSLLVEGGTELLNSFIAANLWDEIRVETAHVYLKDGVPAPALNLLPQSTILHNDSKIDWYRRTDF